MWFQSTNITLLVFFQDDQGYIIQYEFSNGLWQIPFSVAPVGLRARLGSGIGTCYDIISGFQRLRVYAQVPAGDVVSRDYSEQDKSRWNDVYSLYNAWNDVKEISAVTSRNTNLTVTTVSLFFVNAAGEVYVLNFGGRGWAKVPEKVVENSGGTIAASDWDGLQVYFQEEMGRL
ncbi:hypothetical protein K440DRAFT_629308 [Wilcoxina mikolae CBS 423.85]|nr:hypothetical protein K440DRAFT_629308 [Wilcoxina mikolae CBS 423.85]